jgi:predicted 2-oxoglutarate/Fe(II)-dependent dioxygenase YbiX
MKTDLKDYIKIYNVIDEQMCNETVKQLSIAEWTKHTYHNPTEEKFISYDDDLSVSNDRISNKMELMDKTWNCFRTYLNELDMEWYFSWQAHSEIRFNRYDINTQMRIHCDHIHTLFDGQQKGIPTMSALGILNDDYGGGEFLMFGDEKIDLRKGDIMVFPSNFLYPHLVKPVTSGVRYSFVSWAW